MAKASLPVEPAEPCKHKEKEVLREAVWHVVLLNSWIGEGRRDVLVEGEA